LQPAVVAGKGAEQLTARQPSLLRGHDGPARRRENRPDVVSPDDVPAPSSSSFSVPGAPSESRAPQPLHCAEAGPHLCDGGALPGQRVKGPVPELGVESAQIKPRIRSVGIVRVDWEVAGIDGGLRGKEWRGRRRSVCVRCAAGRRAPRPHDCPAPDARPPLRHGPHEGKEGAVGESFVGCGEGRQARRDALCVGPKAVVLRRRRRRSGV
jgi:hypothetical protein